MTSPVFLKLEGKPACLMVPNNDHTGLFLKLQNEEESRQYLARYWPIGRKSETEWIDKANTSTADGVFTVALYPNLIPVGAMGLHRIDWKNRRATTGTVLLEKHCGKGVGTCAKMLLLNWAFNELGLNKVESRVIAFNGRSMGYRTKCGYREVGRLKRHFFRRGAWHDEIILEVHASDWQPLWKKFQAGKSKWSLRRS